MHVAGNISLVIEACADLAGQVAGDWRLGGNRGSQLQFNKFVSHLLVGCNLQVRRLLQIDCKSSLESQIEMRLAGVVLKVCNHQTERIRRGAMPVSPREENSEAENR